MMDANAFYIEISRKTQTLVKALGKNRPWTLIIRALVWVIEPGTEACIDLRVIQSRDRGLSASQNLLVYFTLSRDSPCMHVPVYQGYTTQEANA